MFNGSASILACAVKTVRWCDDIPSGVSTQPRTFFDKLDDWAPAKGAPGLACIVYADGAPKGPIAKFLDPPTARALKAMAGPKDGDAVFIVSDRKRRSQRRSCWRRSHQDAHELGLIDEGDSASAGSSTSRCTSSTRDRQGRIQPQSFFDAAGRSRRAQQPDPLTIKAFQYDIVCNGVELCFRRDPQPSPGHHVPRLRNRGLPTRRRRLALQRAASMR